MDKQHTSNNASPNNATKTAGDLTTIAQGLRITDNHASYDAACKRLLSKKQFLLELYRAV